MKREAMIEAVLHRFPGCRVEILDKGWSEDLKFVLQGENSQTLLRVSKKSLEAQQEELDLVGALASVEGMIHPLEVGGLFEEWTYIRYTFLPGEDLREALPKLAENLQEELGIQAGRLLRRIHEVPAKREGSFGTFFSRKLDRKIQAYHDSQVVIPELEQHLPYIADHRHLLEHRPTRLQHGDFHPGNMLLHENSVGIIDFNRWDKGDPYEEFNRLPACSQVSLTFAQGLLRGYFSENPPEEFFLLLKLYVLSNALGSVRWAQLHSPESLDYVLNVTRETCSWYPLSEDFIPHWYKAR